MRARPEYDFMPPQRLATTRSNIFKLRILEHIISKRSNWSCRLMVIPSKPGAGGRRSTKTSGFSPDYRGARESVSPARSWPSLWQRSPLCFRYTWSAWMGNVRHGELRRKPANLRRGRSNPGSRTRRNAYDILNAVDYQVDVLEMDIRAPWNPILTLLTEEAGDARLPRLAFQKCIVVSLFRKLLHAGENCSHSPGPEPSSPLVIWIPATGRRIYRAAHSSVTRF
jgi:hypothetical protein